MIPMLALALTLAAAPAADPPKPSTAPGLIGTAQMAVRVTVVDRCRVGSAGVTCEGVAPIRPLAVSRAASTPRIDIVF